MRNVNKVILIGNLTRDPELKQTTNGQSVVTFGLATNREWMTKDGRKMASAEYHDLVAWAKLGEICHQYLKKGKLVYVEGYLKTHSKLMPDGTKKFRTEIVVQDMIMLEKRPKSDDEEKQILEATSEGTATENAADSAPMSDDVFEG
jgi:single-strand DNA-binding protein